METDNIRPDSFSPTIASYVGVPFNNMEHLKIKYNACLYLTLKYAIDEACTSSSSTSCLVSYQRA
jgi:hypothetical protein